MRKLHQQTRLLELQPVSFVQRNPGAGLECCAAPSWGDSPIVAHASRRGSATRSVVSMSGFPS